MFDASCEKIVQAVIDSETHLVFVFDGEDVSLLNRAAASFFAVNDVEHYRHSYGNFVEHFVPHPSYFHKECMKPGETWFDALMVLNEEDRIISMMTPSFDPHAFLVRIKHIEGDTRVATFTDITQTLIKRIMIENDATLDRNSGAYAKEYFVHIASSYEDGARLNEKRIGAIKIGFDADIPITLKEAAAFFKSNIREDDMLIRWSEQCFLLLFLTENEEKAGMMLQKLNHNFFSQPHFQSVTCNMNLVLQHENEGLAQLVKRA